MGREELCAVVIFAATVATVTIANTKGRIAARCSVRESDSTTTIRITDDERSSPQQHQLVVVKVI